MLTCCVSPLPPPATTIVWASFEAPPAIISIFLGDYLSSILYKTAHGENMVHGDRSYMRIGAPVLPGVLKDDSDRNRTSPFAFTGNKFEFRMVGSTQSAAVPDAFINTILADVFRAVRGPSGRGRPRKAG